MTDTYIVHIVAKPAWQFAIFFAFNTHLILLFIILPLLNFTDKGGYKPYRAGLLFSEISRGDSDEADDDAGSSASSEDDGDDSRVDEEEEDENEDYLTEFENGETCRLLLICCTYTKVMPDTVGAALGKA